MPKGFQKGNTYSGNRKGSKHTKNAKAKISLSKLGKLFSEEHKEKLSEAHKGLIPKFIPHSKGDKHPNWIKDRNLLKVESERRPYDTKYKYWSREVKNRDRWTCKMSNKKCKGKLEAHHILRWEEFPEERYNINNGITLCHFHHPRKRVEEQRLIPVLRGLVEVKELTSTTAIKIH